MSQWDKTLVHQRGIEQFTILVTFYTYIFSFYPLPPNPYTHKHHNPKHEVMYLITFYLRMSYIFLKLHLPPPLPDQVFSELMFYPPGVR